MLARPAPMEEDLDGALVALTQNVPLGRFVLLIREFIVVNVVWLLKALVGEANSYEYLFLHVDSMCHISSVQFPPSESPTVSPTNYTSAEPTNSAPEYDGNSI
jgi:hypothetical protein